MSLSPAPLLRRFQPSGRTVVIAVPFVFLLVFFLLPFLAVVKISFAEMRLAVPPYTDLMAWAGDKLSVVFTMANYRLVLMDDLYFAAYLSSIEVAFVTTLICLLIGYPAAYLIARAPESRRNLLMMAVILPFWTSYLIRVYAWIGLLKDQGLINQVLMWANLIDAPLRLHRTQFGLYVGMVYSYLPYMILPLYAFLVKMNRTLEEAATDLGAPPWQVFLTITLPLSMPGIIAGSLLVFIPSVGEYVIPELLGGADALMIGRVMWDDFFNNIAWPTAAAATCIMVALLLVPMAWFQRIQNREQAK
jgi:putrescine transport system permease protein